MALRQPIPDSSDCYDCAHEKAWVEGALQVATVVCAAALVIPLLAEACIAATLAFLTFQAAYAICLVILAFCEALHI